LPTEVENRNVHVIVLIRVHNHSAMWTWTQWPIIIMNELLERKLETESVVSRKPTHTARNICAWVQHIHRTSLDRTTDTPHDVSDISDDILDLKLNIRANRSCPASRFAANQCAMSSIQCHIDSLWNRDARWKSSTALIILYWPRLVEHQLPWISLLTQVGTRTSYGLQNGDGLFMSDTKAISFFLCRFRL